MTGIQTNGQFLSLAANTVATIRKNNPFLTTDAITGEYSLPVTIVYTEANYKALEKYFSFLVKKQKLKLPATFFDGRAFSFKGTLVIESLDTNLNTPRTGQLTGYFLSGVSSFFSDVKNVLLKDLEWGGMRSFPVTTFSPFDGSSGFWQHVHATWTDASIPYVFYPIRNEGWAGENSAVDFMNKIDDNLVPIQLSYNENITSLCPHIRFVYLLQTMFANYGYTLTGNVITDPDFLELTVPSFFNIPYTSLVGGLIAVDFNLKEQLPPEWTVTDVMINLWQFMGVTFIFDNAKREVNLKALRDIKNGVKKDWTKYCDAKIKSQFTSDPQIFSLTNSFDTNDSLPGTPIDFTKVNVLPAVYSASQRPTANASNLDRYIFVYNENSWSQSIYDTGVYYWVQVAYNMYSYEPLNNTESFETRITTMPVLNTQVVTTNGTFLRLYPACTQEGNWTSKQTEYKPWGLRLLFYRGLAYDYDPATPGPDLTRQYPFATNAIESLSYQHPPHGNWALSYLYEFEGVDKGVYATWWKTWLQLLQNEEIIPARFYLPKWELLQHKPDDVILIRNIPFVVQVMDQNMPYPGFVDCELRRIG